MRLCPAPVSVIRPVMLRLVFALPPMLTSLSSVIGPAQVLFPAMFRSAPLSATPVPLRIRRSVIGLPRFLSCNWELELTVVVPAVGAPAMIAPKPSALGLEATRMPPPLAIVNAPV